MELQVYSPDMTLNGIIEMFTSLIWTRRYSSCGDFKLLAPFTEANAALLVKENIIMKRGSYEAAQIRYVHIQKDSQGLETIEVQGKFLLSWLEKRVIKDRITAKAPTQTILYRMVYENLVAPKDANRRIPNIFINTNDADTKSGVIEYASEQYINVLTAAESAAGAAKLGIRMQTDNHTGRHYFSVYKGRDLTAGNAAGNATCIFSQEFDNIIEQEYTNSTENLKSDAYVGGEEKEGAVRRVIEIGGAKSGLERNEVFVDASDIVQEYDNPDGSKTTLTDEEYEAQLRSRGESALEQYSETLSFNSKINTFANLVYRTDYDLGDRVTCINKRWGIQVNVRITEITETYQNNTTEIDVTFGTSLPTLLTKMRQIFK